LEWVNLALLHPQSHTPAAPAGKRSITGDCAAGVHWLNR